MDLTSWIFVPGVVGGVLIAALLRVLDSRRSRISSDVFANRVSLGGSDVINIAAVRVAGVGGLGLVGLSAAVAWALPGIGLSVLLGAVLGAGLAAFLIWHRRRVGPLPTSSSRPGANTTLSIDQLSRETVEHSDDPGALTSRPIRLTAGSALT